MKPEPEDVRIQKLYREILSEGIDPAQLRAEKKAFISLYFPKKPFFVFRPVVWTPAMAFAVAAFAVFVVRPELFISPGAPTAEQVSAPVPVTASAPAVEAAPQAVSASQPAGKSISFAHVSSEVGPTVVYQKRVDNVPVAVVWVFPKPVAATA